MSYAVAYSFVMLFGISSLLAVMAYWLSELRRTPVAPSSEESSGDVVLAARIVPTASGAMLVDLERKSDGRGERGDLYIISGTIHPGGYVFPPYTLRDPVDAMVRWMEVTGDVLDYELFQAREGGEAMK